jgi:ATP-dependent Clp protease ATP-binding subunit ClpC
MLTYNFDEKSNDVINYAFAEARDLGHQFIGTEHLLLGLALIKGSKVNETFLYYRITAKDIRTELIKLMGEVSDFEGIVDYTSVYGHPF